MKADFHSLQMPTQNFGFRGPRNLRLGARCIVVDRESLSEAKKIKANQKREMCLFLVF